MRRFWRRPLLAIFMVLLLSATLYPAVPTASALSTDLVISQVFGGGGNTGAPFTNDFVEVFNRGTTSVNLSGWSIQYGASTSSSWSVTALTAKVVQPGQYYLVKLASGGAIGAALPTPDSTGTTNMSATSGKVALVRNTTALSGACATGTTVADFIGYGSANCAEGTATAALANTTAALRKGAGCTETDNNLSDFTVGAPLPRNSSSALNACGGSSAAPLLTELLVTPLTTNQPEEYIKVYNPGSTALDLSGWSLTTQTGQATVTTAKATFPSGTTVGARQSVVATLNGSMYRQQVDPYATAATTFEYGTTASGFGTRMTLNTTANLSLDDISANVILQNTAGVETDVVRYAVSTPTPYAGTAWSGSVIGFPQTQGYATTNLIVARAIDEATISATSAGNYKADTNTSNDWLSAATDSRGGWVYWQNPSSPAPTPFSTRAFTVGQMQSLALPTWSFHGDVTGFLGPDNAYATLTSMFNSAVTSIDINIYEFQLADMAQTLVNAKQRGVTIRVLIEGEPCCFSAIDDQTRYVATKLNTAGISVRFLQSDKDVSRFRRYQNVDHAKYAVIDNGATAAQLMVFSGNFKKSSSSENPASGNRDWGVIVHNVDAAQYFEQIFAFDYDPNHRDSLPYGYVCTTLTTAGKPRCNLGAPTAGYVPDLSGDEDPGATYAHPFSARTITDDFAITPVMVPETDLLSSKAILGMIKNAQTAIWFEYATLNKFWGSGVTGASETTTPTPIVDELLNAARRGVQVRVLLDAKFSDPTKPKDNSATVDYLNAKSLSEGLNLSARLMPFDKITGREYPGYNEIHNKGIVVDRTRTLISSINGTQASWTQNREAALIVDNSQMASYFGDAFWYDWYDGHSAPEWPVISKAQYAPTGTDSLNEWFELYNPTTATVDLTGWSMKNGAGQWSFPAGTTILAGKTLTVARTTSGFQSMFGFAPNVAGETLTLANTGDQLRLIGPTGTEVDKVAWVNALPDWNITTATGQSLIRTNACKDTNSVVDWSVGTAQPGTVTCN